MSTRANIKFIGCSGDTLYVDRSHDGFPDVVLPDIIKTVDDCAGKWSGSEIGQLVSYFLGINFNPKERIQDYEPCHGVAGDESCNYYVKYDKEKKKFLYGITKG